MKDFREQVLQKTYPIIYLDATYVKTKRDRVSSEAYYIALGVKEDRTREVIGIYNAPTESASMWDTIFLDLKQRGLERANLVVIDNLTGLDNSIEKHFDTRIQKCVVHLKRHVLNQTKKGHRADMADDLNTIFHIGKENNTQELLYQRALILHEKWSNHYRHLKVFKDKEGLNYYSH
jgi:putative transposase